AATFSRSRTSAPSRRSRSSRPRSISSSRPRTPPTPPRWSRPCAPPASKSACAKPPTPTASDHPTRRRLLKKDAYRAGSGLAVVARQFVGDLEPGHPAAGPHVERGRDLLGVVQAGDGQPDVVVPVGEGADRGAAGR